MPYLVHTAREEIPAEILAHCVPFSPERDEPLLPDMNFLTLHVCPDRNLQEELSAFLDAAGYPYEGCFELTPSEAYPDEWVFDIEPAPYPTMANAGRVLLDPARTSPPQAFALTDPALYARLVLYLDLIRAQAEKTPLLLENTTLALTPLEFATLDGILENAHRQFNDGDGSPVLYLI